jgi:transcriptional regulator of acetoin/glycerol metabolism
LLAADVECLDCAHFDGDLSAAVREVLDSEGAVVLRRVDMLQARSVAALAEVVSAYDRPRVIVTLRRMTGATIDLIRALGSMEIAVAPLRSRREDIAALVEYFLAESPGGSDIRPSKRFLNTLAAAELPGNVRQLKELLEEALVAASGPLLSVDDLPWSSRRAMAPRVLSRIEEAELHELRQALAEANGNRTLAANILQIGRSTLYRRIESYRRRGMEIGL